jgi:beta-phosphoglucomutase
MAISGTLPTTDFRSGTRAVIFDLDGVIADSEPLHQEAFRRLLRELGLDAGMADDWHRFVGTADRPVMERFIEGRTLPGAPTLEELLGRKGRLFLDLVREREPLFPAVPALVQDLAARYVLAVASGSLRTAIAGVLELQGLRRHFRSVLSVQDVARGKPAPDLFLRTAERLEVAPSACVVIEDSVPGVTAARAAGMRVIAITNTTPAERLAASAADAVVADYGAIRSLLLGV